MPLLIPWSEIFCMRLFVQRCSSSSKPFIICLLLLTNLLFSSNNAYVWRCPNVMDFGDGLLQCLYVFNVDCMYQRTRCVVLKYFCLLCVLFTALWYEPCVLMQVYVTKIDRPISWLMGYMILWHGSSSRPSDIFCVITTDQQVIFFNQVSSQRTANDVT